MTEYFFGISISAIENHGPSADLTERSLFNGTVEAENAEEALSLAEAMYKGHINTEYGLMRQKIMEMECKEAGL